MRALQGQSSEVRKSPPALPRMREAIGALAIIVVVVVVGVLLLLAATYAFGRRIIRQHELLVKLGSYQFLVVAVALSVLWMTRCNSRIRPVDLGFRLGNPVVALKAAIMGIVVILVGAASISGAFHAFIPGYGLKGNATTVLAGVGPTTPVDMKVLTIIWVGIEAPLTEETLFRGILFQALRNTFGRYTPGALAVFGGAVTSGVVFGLLHFAWQTFPLLAFVGIVLAYVFQSGRSILSSLLVHAAMNSMVAIYMFRTVP
jgi:membrane protease YdiL (CAAX protease family)